VEQKAAPELLREVTALPVALDLPGVFAVDAVVVEPLLKMIPSHW
tara:strand:+ start:1230 stop:1364 length:135 start_codon:yes stop_codon:yes gene_type:complete